MRDGELLTTTPLFQGSTVAEIEGMLECLGMHERMYSAGKRKGVHTMRGHVAACCTRHEATWRFRADITSQARFLCRRRAISPRRFDSGARDAW